MLDISVLRCVEANSTWTGILTHVKLTFGDTRLTLGPGVARTTSPFTRSSSLTGRRSSALGRPEGHSGLIFVTGLYHDALSARRRERQDTMGTRSPRTLVALAGQRSRSWRSGHAERGHGPTDRAPLTGLHSLSCLARATGHCHDVTGSMDSAPTACPRAAVVPHRRPVDALTRFGAGHVLPDCSPLDLRRRVHGRRQAHRDAHQRPHSVSALAG